MSELTELNIWPTLLAHRYISQRRVRTLSTPLLITGAAVLEEADGGDFVLAREGMGGAAFRRVGIGGAG